MNDADILQRAIAICERRARGPMPPGRRVNEKRNRAGRCTRADYAYSDGSRLAFTWSESRGSSWEVRQ